MSGFKEYSLGLICFRCQGRGYLSSWDDQTLELIQKDCLTCDGERIVRGKNQPANLELETKSTITDTYKDLNEKHPGKIKAITNVISWGIKLGGADVPCDN